MTASKIVTIVNRKATIAYILQFILYCEAISIKSIAKTLQSKAISNSFYRRLRSDDIGPEMDDKFGQRGRSIFKYI